METVVEWLVSAVRSLTRGRGDRRRPAYYDGTEKPELRPPGRYARGTRATAAPPPGIGG